MTRFDPKLHYQDIVPHFERFWELSGRKIHSIAARFDFSEGSPVFTARGRYRSKGWTDWTMGFHFGSALLQYDATGDPAFLEMGREGTLERMASHLTHTGVHDHGFNNVSTYGNLRRLMLIGKIPDDPWQLRYYELALKCSAAVQASRWTRLPDGGFIYSFNGPHSLFADTIRTLRVLALGHCLGHKLHGENDREIDLLERLLDHARVTARYNVYFGEGRDIYDVRGRVAHESIFNLNDGAYRCSSSQQGFSPRSTWTRGLAWILLGYAELLEYMESLNPPEEGREELESMADLMRRVALATGDFYIENTGTDGIPYWDTMAPGLHRLPDWRDHPADPFNSHEPVDSSAAAIAAQGLLRLGHLLKEDSPETGKKYWQAGLTTLSTLLRPPYLSEDDDHQGLLLHSLYHRPNGWDYVPSGRSCPAGESSMWGDYHLREVVLYLQKLAKEDRYLTFWGEWKGDKASE